MEPRERDLLSAVARFLSDYCGEEAVHRWQERLSDAERERLVRAPGSVQERSRRFVGALKRIVQAVLEAVGTLVRTLSEALATACTAIIGRRAEPFGREAA